MPYFDKYKKKKKTLVLNCTPKLDNKNLIFGANSFYSTFLENSILIYGPAVK